MNSVSPTNNVAASEIGITIVIPVYNQAKFVNEAINSVITQECECELQVIVIDDGSTDRVIDVLKKFGRQIYFETRANSGQSVALNHGWSLSKTKFIGYLSADDILMPGIIQKLEKFLIKNPDTSVLHGDFFTIDERGRKIRKVKAKNICLSQMLMNFDLVPGPGAIFRANILTKIGGWNKDLRRIPDFEFWLRVARLYKFTRITEVFAAWRVHGASQAYYGTSISGANEPHRVIEKFFANEDVASEISATKRKSLGVSFLFSAQLHARSGRYVESIKKLLLAFYYDPMALVKLKTYHIILNSIFQKPLQRLVFGIRNLL